MKKKKLKKRIARLEAENQDLENDVIVLLSNDTIAKIGVEIKWNLKDQFCKVMWLNEDSEGNAEGIINLLNGVEDGKEKSR